MPSTNPGDNIRWGAKWGIYAAVFSGAWATLVRVGSGSEPFDDTGLTYGATIGAYLAFGVVGGVLLGVLRGFTRTKTGSGLVGWILAVFVYTGFLTLTGTPPWSWSVFQLIVVLLASLLVGATGGVAHWKRNQRTD